MNYADEAATVSGQAPDAYGLCCANGCPLPGTSTTSTNGSQKWFCRVHFSAPYSEHDGITARINNRAGLYRIALMLSNYGSGEHVDRAVRAQIKALGRADLLQPPAPGTPFSAQGLAAHIYSTLDSECQAPQAHMGVQAADRSTTTWLDEPETV